MIKNEGKNIEFTKIKRVLIAKLRHHGDVLLTSPVFSVLKKHYPHLTIDAYIYSETFPMLSGHPAISQFILYEKKWKKLPFYKRYLHEITLLRNIRKNKYDLVINLTEGDRGAIAAKISQAPYAVGFDPQGSGMKGKKTCYTHLIKHSSRPRHTVEKNLDALRVLGISPKNEEKNLFFHIPNKAKNQVEDLLPQEPFILIHPVSRWMFKTLSPETIAQVIAYLYERKKRVVLTASPDPQEMAMNASICRMIPGVINLSGKSSLKELGAIVERASMLITVDSIPLHLASVMKKPSVAIFGPTCEKNWGPWRNPYTRVVTMPVSCRPCYQPGCGGSGQSDCLMTLPAQRIIDSIHDIFS